MPRLPPPVRTAACGRASRQRSVRMPAVPNKHHLAKRAGMPQFALFGLETAGLFCMCLSYGEAANASRLSESECQPAYARPHGFTPRSTGWPTRCLVAARRRSPSSARAKSSRRSPQARARATSAASEPHAHRARPGPAPCTSYARRWRTRAPHCRAIHLAARGSRACATCTSNLDGT